MNIEGDTNPHQAQTSILTAHRKRGIQSLILLLLGAGVIGISFFILQATSFPNVTLLRIVLNGLEENRLDLMGVLPVMAFAAVGIGAVYVLPNNLPAGGRLFVACILGVLCMMSIGGLFIYYGSLQNNPMIQIGVGWWGSLAGVIIVGLGAFRMIF